MNYFMQDRNRTCKFPPETYSTMLWNAKKNRGEPRVNKQNPHGFPFGFLPVPQLMPGSTSPMAPKKPPANDSPMSKGGNPRNAENADQ